MQLFDFYSLSLHRRLSKRVAKRLLRGQMLRKDSRPCTHAWTEEYELIGTVASSAGNETAERAKSTGYRSSGWRIKPRKVIIG